MENRLSLIYCQGDEHFSRKVWLLLKDKISTTKQSTDTTDSGGAARSALLIGDANYHSDIIETLRREYTIKFHNIREINQHFDRGMTKGSIHQID